MKLEIESRPTQEDFDSKVQQCNALRVELSNLNEQMTSNQKLLEQMQMELSEERERQEEIIKKSLAERASQTDLNESTKEVPAVDEVVASSSSVLAESPPVVVVAEQPKPSTELPQPAAPSIADDDDDDALNNHPKVLYEDELIVFKEICSSLTAENTRLHREIGELRANQLHGSWLHNFVLKYLVPVIIVLIAYIFFLLK